MSSLEKSKAPPFVVKEFHSTGTTRVYTITDVHTGKTDAVIDYTLQKRMPVQELQTALDLFDKLEASGGRRIYDLEELANGTLVDKSGENHGKARIS